MDDQWADRSPSEYAVEYQGLGPLEMADENTGYMVEETRRLQDVPSTFDAVAGGFNLDTDHQGGCGSCWAFAAAHSAAGNVWKKTGKVVDLSKQFAMDCQ